MRAWSELLLLVVSVVVRLVRVVVELLPVVAVGRGAVVDVSSAVLLRRVV